MGLLPQEGANSGKVFGILSREKEKIHMSRVDRTLEMMSWMMEFKSIKEEVKWLKAREAGIEQSRA